MKENIINTLRYQYQLPKKTLCKTSINSFLLTPGISCKKNINPQLTTNIGTRYLTLLVTILFNISTNGRLDTRHK